MRKQKFDVYQLCACGSGKKIKWCHPQGFYPKVSYPEVEADLRLGEKLVKERDGEKYEFFDKYGWFTGKLSEECIKDCSHSGDCFDDVEFWVKKLDFQVPREKAILYLKETGGWSAEELDSLDDVGLAQKILWLACCDFKENGEWFGLVN